jgi:hypothetical protein
MAMFVADLEAAGAKIEQFCEPHFSSTNNHLYKAAIFRFTRSAKALDDELLLLHSHSESKDIRIFVAEILRNRESPYRKAILKRLMNDPVRRVASRASFTAGMIRDEELADLLARECDFRALSFVGDPRARTQTEALVDCADSLGCGEAIATALALGDLCLLERLWNNPAWEVRCAAILGSVGRGYLDGERLDAVLTRQNEDQLIDLTLRWLFDRPDLLPKLANLICEPTGLLPPYDALASGRADAIDRLWKWVSTSPMRCGAGVRLLPEDKAVSLIEEMMCSPHAECRIEAIRVVAYGRFEACYPLVAERCVDSNKAVADAANGHVEFARMKCGLYGIDTSILKAGDDFDVSNTVHFSASRLIERLLSSPD